MVTVQLLVSRRGDRMHVQVTGLNGAEEAQRTRRIHAWTRYFEVDVRADMRDRPALSLALLEVVNSLRED